MRILQSFFLIATILLLGSGCNFDTLDDKSKFTLIPGRANTLHAQFDRPTADVEAAVRATLSALGTITEEKRLPVTDEEVTKNVFTARINTRHVRVSVKPSKESPDVISDMRIQAWTKSRNPDLMIASEIKLAVFSALVNASLKQTSN